MKNTFKRFLFGMFSSALLAVGFVRAADRFDPISHSVPAPDAVINGAVPGSTTECDVVLNVR